MKYLLSRILKILSPAEKKTFSRLILLDILISALDIAFLGLLLFIVTFYTQNSNTPYFSYLPQQLFNKNSLLLIILFLALFCCKNWLGFMTFRAQYRFIYGTASRLSKSNLINYLKGGYINYINTDSSEHIRKISQQPIEFSHYILSGTQQIITQTVLILFTLLAIVIYKPFLFLLLFLLLLPPVAFVAYLIKKQLKAVRLGTKQAHEKNLQHLNEALAGYVESNIYNKGDFFLNRYYRYQQEQNHHLARQQILQGLPSRLIEVFAVLGFVILVVLNKWLDHNGALNFLTIGAFLAASYKIIPGIVKILNCSGQIKTYEFTLADLNKTITIDDTNSHTQERIESIAFKNVSFSYKNRLILKGLSFGIKRGDIAALSANSGKGKTTAINLLLGFLKPDEGDILFNGLSTNSAGGKIYWNRISYLKQQTFFIHDTILKNITLSDDKPHEKKLTDALKISGFEAEVNKQPDGINYIINQDGKNLSGGQRQRLSLARALYHDFDLLILDEPFSELDEQAETAILKHLQILAEAGKAIILITHHTASLCYCNKVISLNDKRYAEA